MPIPASQNLDRRPDHILAAYMALRHLTVPTLITDPGSLVSPSPVRAFFMALTFPCLQWHIFISHEELGT